MKLRLSLVLISFIFSACATVGEQSALPIQAPQVTSLMLISPSPTRMIPSATQSPLPPRTQLPKLISTATVRPTGSPSPTSDILFYDAADCLPRNTPTLQGTVTQVVDGDTIVVLASDGITYTVRYIGIDAPESGMPFSQEASAANTALVLSQPVTLIQDVSETDQYGRLLRYVLVGDRLVNLELVRMGLASAQAWLPDTVCAEAFQTAESEARTAQLGMWAATPTPEPSAPRLVIVTVNKREEFVDIQNQGEADIDLSGWNLVSERGHQECPLSGVLAAGATLRIWAMATQGFGFSCGYGSPIWNNSEPDPAVLYNPQGVEMSRK